MCNLPKATRDRIDRAQCDRIFRRDRSGCQFCGATGAHGPLVIEMVIPVHRGGWTDDRNLCVACVECSEGRSELPAVICNLPPALRDRFLGTEEWQWEQDAFRVGRALFDGEIPRPEEAAWFDTVMMHMDDSQESVRSCVAIARDVRGMDGLATDGKVETWRRRVCKAIWDMPSGTANAYVSGGGK